MLILAVETSCDETAFALHDGRKLVSHCLFSQTVHTLYDGVVPELAARNHLQRLLPLLKECLRLGQARKQDITHIAYTMGPGLITALMTGGAFARCLAYGLGVPALGIHHLEGHLLSPLLAKEKPPFPYLALLVSGGHTQLQLVEGTGRYTLHGETLDDAAGEAFDKVGTLLDLDYPAGSQLEQLARQGNPQAYALTVPMRHSGDYNFSFSGLKTQVSRHMATIKTTQQKADLAASFQMTMAKSLLGKTFALATKLDVANIVLVGGVSANQYLRKQMTQLAAEKRVFFPPLEYCTDNAAMIALAAVHRIATGKQDSLAIRAQARLPIPA